MTFPDIDPVIFSFGIFTISWYSVAYVAGILLGNFYILWVLKNNQYLTITKQNISEFVSWVIIGIIVGGRLGYVIFYNPIRYLKYPLDILKTYEGGMSFHGGIIGCIMAIFIFAKKKGINFLSLSDLCCCAAPIGIFFGRIANFINGELYGRFTDLSWGVIFPGQYYPRHPTQLYEAVLEGLILFGILFFVILRMNILRNPGKVSGIFLICYSVFRMLIEFVREPDIQIGLFIEIFTLGQLLSLPMLFSGIFLILRRNDRIPNS